MKRSLDHKAAPRPDGHLKAITHIGLRPPVELFVMITDGCNLKCRHCWPRAKNVTAASSISRTEFQGLLNNFTQLGVHQLTLTGGEPLTHPDCMAMLTDAARQTGISEVCLQTNGTLLTPECIALIKTLPREKIRIQVSLDGAHAASHDRLRRTECFNQTIEGLQRLTAIGWGPNVRLAFTETESTMDELPDLLELAETMSVGQVVSGCLVKKGRAETDGDVHLPRPDQYRSMLARYHRDDSFRQRYGRIGNFSAIEWWNGRTCPADNRCQCMRMPYVTASGDLFPCKMLPVQRWRIADIFSRPFDEIVVEL